MSTLLGVFRSISSIAKILELMKYFREAWRKHQNATQEADTNARNDAAIDELAGLHDSQSGQHSSTTSGPTSPTNGRATPDGR